MARTVEETIREQREAQQMGLRVAAERIGISPVCLSRTERGKERPLRPEVVKRIAMLLGGDPDLLFRLAESTDPDLAECIHVVPNVPEFLRIAMAQKLTSENFDVLNAGIKRNRPSEALETGQVRNGEAPGSPRGPGGGPRARGG